MNAPPTTSPTVPWRVRLGVPLGMVLLRLLGATWRIEFRGAAWWHGRREAHTACMLALWHGHLLPLAFAMRGQGIHVLVSEHRDGEVIAQVLHRLGYSTVRGSTSRGGARALVEMVRLLRGGCVVGVTPDGPRGPAMRFTPGALVAAQRAGAPVVTLFATATRAWHLGSWDRFMIPKPFAKVVVHFGDATLVDGETPADAERQAERFAAMLAPRTAGHG